MEKKINIMSIVMMIISLILMLLPYGVAMTFVPNPIEEPIISYYSFFNIMPFGYGNGLPMLIVFLSIVVLALLIFKNKIKSPSSILVILFVLILLMLFSWTIFNSCTIVAMFIMVIHIVVLALQAFIEKNNARDIKKDEETIQKKVKEENLNAK